MLIMSTIFVYNLDYESEILITRPSLQNNKLTNKMWLDGSRKPIAMYIL